MTPNLDETPPVVDAAEEISLATSVAGIALRKPLWNSPNPLATTTDMLQAIANSPSTGAFTTRTVCPGFVHDDAKHQWRAHGSAGKDTINCLGYSCYDFDYYVEAIKQVQAKQPDKPAFFSITGTAPEVATLLKETAEVFGEAAAAQVLVEINLSCPNIGGHPPVAYDFPAMRAYLSTALGGGTHNLKVGLKLTPYFYDGQFVAAAAVLNEMEGLAFITTINTVGCGLAVDVETEAPLLAEASGASFGGLGGPGVYAVALGNVRRLRQLLKAEIDIIGVGGISSGEAVFCHLLCGASACMLASCLLTEGVDCFARIEDELKAIMQKKGYTSLDQVKGKLKDGSAGFTCPAKA
jgi:dihydroorotate dehydrogenase (fumarate)